MRLVELSFSTENIYIHIPDSRDDKVLFWGNRRKGNFEKIRCGLRKTIPSEGVCHGRCGVPLEFPGLNLFRPEGFPWLSPWSYRLMLVDSFYKAIFLGHVKTMDKLTWFVESGIYFSNFSTDKMFCSKNTCFVISSY